MATLQETEAAISNFTPTELAKFRAWFEEFDAGIWDEQFEEDVKVGKLDVIAEKAIANFRKGKFKEL